MVLVQKWPFFQLLFFRQYKPGKCLLRYSKAKKPLSRLYQQEVYKVEKLTFFKRGNPWFWSENEHFSNFFFLGNIGQENLCYYILKRKTLF